MDTNVNEIDLYKILIQECEKDITEIKGIVEINEIITDNNDIDNINKKSNFMKLDFLSYKLNLVVSSS